MSPTLLPNSVCVRVCVRARVCRGGGEVGSVGGTQAHTHRHTHTPTYKKRTPPLFPLPFPPPRPPGPLEEIVGIPIQSNSDAVPSRKKMRKKKKMSKERIKIGTPIQYNCNAVLRVEVGGGRGKGGGEDSSGRDQSTVSPFAVSLYACAGGREAGRAGVCVCRCLGRAGV